MDKIIVKNLALSALILGFVLGVLSVIPYVGVFALLIACLLSAPLCMLYLIMDSKLDLTTVQASIVQGALVGFFTNLSFCSVYSVLTILISVAFKYTNNLILTSMIAKSPIWLFLTAVIFIGVLLAVTNAFSGFLTYYIINTIRDIYERKNLHNEKDDINGRI